MEREAPQLRNFALRIELGNAEMQDGGDVASALVQVADGLRRAGAGVSPGDTWAIADRNGNTVGRCGFDYHGVDLLDERVETRTATQLELALERARAELLQATIACASIRAREWAEAVQEIQRALQGERSAIALQGSVVG